MANEFGVVGGETRRLALCLLRDGGVRDAVGYTDDFVWTWGAAWPTARHCLAGQRSAAQRRAADAANAAGAARAKPVQVACHGKAPT